MRKDCANEMQLSPPDLKSGVTAALNKLLAPVQEEFKSSKEFQEIEKLAYPPEVKVKKVKKDGQKGGTQHPNKGSQNKGTKGQDVQEVDPKDDIATSATAMDNLTV